MSSLQNTEKITGGTAVKKGFRYNIARNKTAYLLILPAMIVVFFMSYLPFAGVIMAFKDYDIIKGILGSPWIGLDNFIEVFNNPNMLLGIWNSLIYGLVILFGGMPFPIILALLFNEIRGVRFKKVVQTVSYMPHFLSWVMVISMFTSMFSLEGTFNSIMKVIVGEGYEPVNILYDARNFLPIIFVTHLWKSVG